MRLVACLQLTLIVLASTISYGSCQNYGTDPSFCKMVAECSQKEPPNSTSDPPTPGPPPSGPLQPGTPPPGQPHPSQPTPTPKPSEKVHPTKACARSSCPSQGVLMEDPNGPYRCRKVSNTQSADEKSSTATGGPVPIPGSYHGRIPCSSPRKQKPCLGNLDRTWDYAYMKWSDEYSRSGYPQPWTLPPGAYSDGDRILEIVDWQYQTSHYQIVVDGQVADETDEEDFANEALECNAPDMCIEKGFGRAFALVPRSSQSVEIRNSAGLTVFNSGCEHAYENFAWRLWGTCEC